MALVCHLENSLWFNAIQFWGPRKFCLSDGRISNWTDYDEKLLKIGASKKDHVFFKTYRTHDLRMIVIIKQNSLCKALLSILQKPAKIIFAAVNSGMKNMISVQKFQNKSSYVRQKSSILCSSDSAVCYKESLKTRVLFCKFLLRQTFRQPFLDLP